MKGKDSLNDSKSLHYITSPLLYITSDLQEYVLLFVMEICWRPRDNFREMYNNNSSKMF